MEKITANNRYKSSATDTGFPLSAAGDLYLLSFAAMIIL